MHEMPKRIAFSFFCGMFSLGASGILFANFYVFDLTGWFSYTINAIIFFANVTFAGLNFAFVIYNYLRFQLALKEKTEN